MHKNKTILVLGKNKKLLQTLNAQLSEGGYTALPFFSPLPALKIVKNNGITAAIMFEDLEAEKITRFIRAVKDVSPVLPIILLASENYPDHLTKLINEGIMGFLPPQYTCKELYKAIQNAESQRQEFQQQANTEQNYQQLYSNLQDGVVTVNLEGRILACNHAFEKICGYSLKEINQTTFWEITPKKWHKVERKILKDHLLTEGTTGFYEKEYIRKDGGIIPVELCAYPTLDDQGNLIGMWAFVHNISRRKQHEEENKKHQNQIIQQKETLIELSRLTNGNFENSLRLFTEKAAESIQTERVSIWVFENDQKHLTCLDLFESSKNVHRQESDLSLDDYPAYFSSLKKNRIIAAHDAARDPSTREFNKSYLIPNKITSMLDCSINRQENLLGVVCFEHVGEARVWSLEEQNFAASLADIAGRIFETNERLQTENNLRKSEVRYRNIFETSTIAIAELDFSNVFKEFDLLGLKNIEEITNHLSNNPGFLIKIIREIRVTDVNQAALDLFEVNDINEIPTFVDLFGENRSQRDFQRLIGTLAHQKPFYDGETNILTKKGHFKTIYFHMPLPRREKNLFNVLLNIIDISARIQAEVVLKRKLQEITALHGIATASTESTSVDALIERTTLLLGETLFPDNFGILTVDENHQTICPHPSYRGISPAALKLVEPIDKGITGRAVQTGNPQRIAQVKKDKDYIQIKTDTLSELVVPIKINGKIIGVVNTESTLENAYSEADENFLMTFSNQLALAIERMRLLEAQQRQTREVTALYETAISISGLLDTEKLINRIYLQVSDLFPLDSFLMAFNEEETSEIHIAVAMEENRVLSEMVDQRLPIHDSGLIGWVIQNQKTLLIGDLKTDPLPVKPIHVKKPVRSWLGVPLITHGKTIGALAIQSFQPFIYEENHSRLLESMAAQIATSLENAQLIEQTQNRLQRLSALHDIDLVINSSLDLRVTMNILLDQVIEKLGVDAASVMLLNTKTQLLEFSAGRGFRTRKIEEYHLRLGEGISGQAAMERHLVQSLNLSDLDENSAYPTLLSDEGFISYYSVPLIAKGQVKGVLDIFNRSLVTPDQEWVNFLETLAGQAAIAIDNTTLLEDLHRSNIELTLAYDTTLEGWSHALDLRDKETEGHTQRVVEMTLKIAKGLGMDDTELTHLRRGALLHDIGKMGIPDEILFKPGSLTNEEWIIMRRHPQMAYDLLHPIVHLRPSVDIPYCHHERWDGNGYPRGLKGEQIPHGARIFSVVDVWDALTSDRPYRKAWSAKHALDFIKEQKGAQFDPKVVDLFLILVKNEMSNQ